MSFLDRLHNPRAGIVLMRNFLALMMLFHGMAKVFKGVNGIESMLSGAGLPAFFAYGVYIGEVFAPLLLLAGVLVAPAALIIAFNMVVAIALAHSGAIFSLGKSGGLALELQYFFLVSSIVVALTADRFYFPRVRAQYRPA